MTLPNEGEPPKREAAGSAGNPGPKKLEDLQRNITMSQIAKAANVSQGAISSMLNDRNYGIRVSEKTRTHVFKVCRQMGYIPNDLRAVVRMYPEFGGYSLLIASDIPGGILNPLVARIAAGAMGALPDALHALSIGLYDPAADYSVEGAALPQSVGNFVSSKFLIVGTPNPSLVENLTKRGLAVMCLGYELALPGVVSFVPDFGEAARMAIAHLVKLGHRQIGIVSGPFGSVDPQVIAFNHGVRVASEEQKLPAQSLRVVYGDLSADGGRKSYDELLAQRSQPTAIFCMSDAAALGVIERAQSGGIEVPNKLSVIGCGDHALAAISNPPLTTIRQPAEEIAKSAIQELDNLVHGDLPPGSRKIVPPLSLVERRSCAPLK
jgi:DNA-binding LacI/PurR family transcriptional regulator